MPPQREHVFLSRERTNVMMAAIRGIKVKTNKKEPAWSQGVHHTVQGTIRISEMFQHRPTHEHVECLLGGRQGTDVSMHEYGSRTLPIPTAAFAHAP